MSSGHVIGIRAGRSGDGATFIAAHLVRVAATEGQRPLLVDASYPSGDAAAVMGASKHRQETVNGESALPALFANTVMWAPTGAAVLPLLVASAREVLAAETIGALFRAARQSFGLIVIDLADGASPLTAGLLDECDRVCIITTPSVRAMARAHAVRGDVTLHGLPASRVSYCLNRSSLLEHVEGALNPPPVAVMPELTSPRVPVDRLRSSDERAIQTLWLELARHPVPLADASINKPDERHIVARVKQRLREQLASDVLLFSDLSSSRDSATDLERRRRIAEELQRLMDEEFSALLPRPEVRRRTVQAVLDEVLGLGPLEPLLADDEVDEIMVNGPSHIYVERRGKLAPTDVAFDDAGAAFAVIERILGPIGRRVDESSPRVDARLQDGSRVNIVVPPLARNGPCITIRKFPKRRLCLADLLQIGSLDERMSAFLRLIVQAKQNVVVSGSTGSGKTTLLNVLTSFIPDHERIITIEDPAELQLQQDHVVSLEARPPNLEGEGAVTQLELVTNALRMRPDRLVVGEARGREALAMLRAMSTGHAGSLTTVHAGSATVALQQIETMVLMNQEAPPAPAIRRQIASSINFVVQQNRQPGGRRRVTAVTELAGLSGEEFLLRDVFVFREQGVDHEGAVIGHFTPTGYVPTIVTTLQAVGRLTVPPEMFVPLRD